MSEQIKPATSHAELDKDLYGADMSETAILDARADAAAADRVAQERIDNAYEKVRGERATAEMGAGAIRAAQAEDLTAHHAAVDAKSERAALEDGAMKAFLAREAGKNIDPTAAFQRQQAENAVSDAALQDAGRVDTLNAGFSRKIELATDPEGGIDVSKLNPNELIRYKASINPLVNESAAAYEKRMQEVFKTSDYIGVIEKIMDPGDIFTLGRIEARDPGVNPLAEAMSKHLAAQAERETA